jgi:hypothetical protein
METVTTQAENSIKVLNLYLNFWTDIKDYQIGNATRRNKNKIRTQAWGNRDSTDSKRTIE